METKDRKIRLLVVDDEEDIREILHFNLEYEGFEIDTAESAEEALAVLTDEHRLILLDVMMEGMSGFKMADKLRKEGNRTPIIFLTAKDTENDMLTGFSIGGDDYISKPFSIKEVVARVKSVLKRTESTASGENRMRITIHALVIDKSLQQVTVQGENIELTKTEYNILVLLAENEGHTFSRSEILSQAWEGDGIVLDRTVDVHITRLRKKLGEYGQAIVNRIGYGYRFDSDMLANK